MVMRYRIVYPDELNHYGVKGMKWGVRKDSVAGRSRFDQDVESEKLRIQEKIRQNPGLRDYNVTTGDIYGSFTDKLSSAGSTYIKLSKSKGKAYANKWLSSSSPIKDYEYEIIVNNEKTSTGKYYTSGVLKIKGDKYDYKVGIEGDYSDDESLIEKRK